MNGTKRQFFLPSYYSQVLRWVSVYINSFSLIQLREKKGKRCSRRSFGHVAVSRLTHVVLNVTEFMLHLVKQALS